MRKTRFLVLVLTVAVMLMGAGYAWWSETVTINNSVLTGFLDVDIVNPYADTYYGNETKDNTWAKAVIDAASHKYDNDGNDDGIYSDWVGVTFTNLYPGSYGRLVVPIKNTGTVPAKLSQLIFAVEDKIDENNIFNWFDDKTISIWFTPTLYDGRYEEGYEIELDPSFWNGQLNGYVINDIDKTVIAPGEYLYLVVTAKLDDNADNSQEMADQLGFYLYPTFIQFNQP